MCTFLSIRVSVSSDSSFSRENTSWSWKGLVPLKTKRTGRYIGNQNLTFVQKAREMKPYLKIYGKNAIICTQKYFTAPILSHLCIIFLALLVGDFCYSLQYSLQKHNQTSSLTLTQRINSSNRQMTWRDEMLEIMIPRQYLC